jgi:hypothetical protein
MSPTDVKEKLNIIADYVTNAAASDTSTVKVIYSMLNEISPKGEHLGFEGELFNTPHPVCKNLTTTIDEGGDMMMISLTLIMLLLILLVHPNIA